MRYSRFTHLSHLCKTLAQIPNLTSRPISRPCILAPNHESNSKSEPPSFFAPGYSSASQSQDTEKVSAIVDEVMGLTLLEVMDLVEVMREKKGINELPIMMLMVPRMGVRGLPKGVPKGGGGGGGGEEKKVEKTAFDVKLDAFDAASKIKVIKEVRTFTSLGLKEAKDLVEKVPTVLKIGVTKEEAETIIAKMKEVGAKAFME